MTEIGTLTPLASLPVVSLEQRSQLLSGSILHGILSPGSADITLTLTH